MADMPDVGRMTLNDSQHAGPPQNGFGGAQKSYIPPHARSNGGPPPFHAGPGMDGSAWGPQG